jgi:hypothetical protein
MKSVPRISRWQEGRVDLAREHFELRYGSAEDGGWSDWTPVAVIGPPTTGIVNVQFLVEPGDPKNAESVSDVKQSLTLGCTRNTIAERCRISPGMCTGHSSKQARGWS